MKHYLLRLTEEEHYRLKNYATELDMPIKELLIKGAEMQYTLGINGKRAAKAGEKLKQCSQEQYEEDKKDD